jgi:predicted PurR-regulated permease PerM
MRAGIHRRRAGGVQQIQALLVTLQRLLEGVPAQLAALSAQPIAIGPWTLSLTTSEIIPLVERGLSTIEPLLGRASTLVATGAAHALESLARLIFVLAVSYFLTVDHDRSARPGPITILLRARSRPFRRRWGDLACACAQLLSCRNGRPDDRSDERPGAALGLGVDGRG